MKEGNLEINAKIGAFELKSMELGGVEDSQLLEIELYHTIRE